jgi:hypothetical protein
MVYSERMVDGHGVRGKVGRCNLNQLGLSAPRSFGELGAGIEGGGATLLSYL